MSRAISKPIDGAGIPLHEREVTAWSMARAAALADGLASNDDEAAALADEHIQHRRLAEAHRLAS